MKKLIFTLLLFSLFFMLPNSALADSKLENCTVETMEASTGNQTCLMNGGKIQAYYLNCGTELLADNEVCCCQAQIDYSCTWKPKYYTPGTGGAGVVATAGSWSQACQAGETEGSDCNIAKKPPVITYSSGRETNYTCCCPGADTYVEKAKFIIPQWQIPIDLELSKAQCTGPENSGECAIPWIAQYINFIYNYGLGIGGILAAVVLMAGGLLWLVSGGDVSKITQAKSLIIGSITGLMILFGSYILLTQINPELITLKPISVKMIERIVIELDSEGTTPVVLDMDGMKKILGINCDTDSVADIINKSKGKITYNNPSRGTVGPNNSVYNDCSGFASFVLKCAYNKDAKSYTGDIFAEQKIWNENINSLQPGDLIGWAPQNSDKKLGHVFIYMGNGVFGDCHGGTNGRKPGNCVSTNLNLTNLKDSASSYSEGKLFIKRY